VSKSDQNIRKRGKDKPTPWCKYPPPKLPWRLLQWDEDERDPIRTSPATGRAVRILLLRGSSTWEIGRVAPLTLRRRSNLLGAAGAPMNRVAQVQTLMVERKPYDKLPCEDLGWLSARRHLPAAGSCDESRSTWGCIRGWSEEEIAANTDHALEAHANVEIVIYVTQGTVTHRDSLGNQGRFDTGSVQVVSAGTGIRHIESNLERVPARIFRILIAPSSSGGSPAWAAQPCLTAEGSGCFVAIASGFDGDQDALPIRAGARVLNAKLKVGESIAHALHEPRRAYLVPSSGVVDVNGDRIRARDGAAIWDVDTVTITALEDADVVMIEVSLEPGRDQQTS
jgi:redox-sensitive bicupin YhaK (pirin superfamily)